VVVGREHDGVVEALHGATGLPVAPLAAAA
jgi:hypothetical protein